MKPTGTVSVLVKAIWFYGLVSCLVMKLSLAVPEVERPAEQEQHADPMTVDTGHGAYDWFAARHLRAWYMSIASSEVDVAATADASSNQSGIENELTDSDTALRNLKSLFNRNKKYKKNDSLIYKNKQLDKGKGLSKTVKGMNKSSIKSSKGKGKGMSRSKSYKGKGMSNRNSKGKGKGTKEKSRRTGKGGNRYDSWNDWSNYWGCYPRPSPTPARQPKPSPTCGCSPIAPFSPNAPSFFDGGQPAPTPRPAPIPTPQPVVQPTLQPQPQPVIQPVIQPTPIPVAPVAPFNPAAPFAPSSPVSPAAR
jgi:hypothetical protein